jgi:hypothetical protein
VTIRRQPSTGRGKSGDDAPSLFDAVQAVTESAAAIAGEVVGDIASMAFVTADAATGIPGATARSAITVSILTQTAKEII